MVYGELDREKHINCPMEEVSESHYPNPVINFRIAKIMSFDMMQSEASPMKQS